MMLTLRNHHDVIDDRRVAIDNDRSILLSLIFTGSVAAADDFDVGGLSIGSLNTRCRVLGPECPTFIAVSGGWVHHL